ncbi:SDR family NAD(P)-dependent oxidoreductase [Nocardia terpenica]|uniref:SDR family NAD(P)-dependent oxidoreductase n=1 Tax=Nocardia terpenica TaxID=455432 RepID=A0A6G9ZD12_9NOCA|nr:SDR family NAD(P)-dependent oxidoreductase [Nocardia terpenica]QIS23392.1 SDR family NAD(P)-dependent oxidoreductase [Nocardia terpenica]
MKFEEKRVLLTGASGGLGRTIARELARRGAHLILTGRNTSALDALTRECDSEVVAADLAEPDAAVRLVDAAGRIDIVVANAGLPCSGLLTELSITDIDRAIDVNLRSHMIIARQVIGGMRERRSGHLVFMSSLSGKTAAPRSSVYSATKFALRGFSLALREELRNDGIGVSAIFPGFIRDAGLFADAGSIRLPRFVGISSPEDVAAAVVRAVRGNVCEIDVASASLRIGARFATVVPEFAAVVQRRFGADRITAELAAGQTGKR